MLEEFVLSGSLGSVGGIAGSPTRPGKAGSSTSGELWAAHPVLEVLQYTSGRLRAQALHLRPFDKLRTGKIPRSKRI